MCWGHINSAGCLDLFQIKRALCALLCLGARCDADIHYLYSMDLEKRVSSFIAQHQLMQPGTGVLVALSGGADSVALLHMLLRLGFRCCAVHCNFHLRGDESLRDEEFVVALCRALGVPCEVVHFDTMAYAAEHKMSVEMAARELRYGEFERIRQACGLEVVAVAHHQGDAVETFLLNLIRGAGINGLTGMRVVNGHVVRPLLCLTRDEVLSYLHGLGQTYVTDSTNLTDVYARNKVRLGLLPLMREINPAAAANIMQAAGHLADAAAIYNKVIADNSDRVVTLIAGGADIDMALLMATEVPRAQLFEILSPYGFNGHQVDDVLRAMPNGVGRMFYSAGYVLLCDRTHLLLRQRSADENADALFLLPEEGVVELPDGARVEVNRVVPDAGWCVPRGSNVCVLDASHIGASLTLRHPKEGDRFHPFGMKGSKLLSDLYTDLKLNRMARAQQWVLCHGDEIVWAVGVRASEHCRLRGGESEVVQVTFVPSCG